MSARFQNKSLVALYRTVRTAWAGPSPQSSGPHTKFQNKIKENDESKSWISSFSRDPQTRLLDNLVRVSLLSLDYFSYRQTLQTKSLPNMKSFIFLDVAHNSVEITEIYFHSFFAKIS